jgi:hypothetical protein
MFEVLQRHLTTTVAGRTAVDISAHLDLNPWAALVVLAALVLLAGAVFTARSEPSRRLERIIRGAARQARRASDDGE